MMKKILLMAIVTLLIIFAGCDTMPAASPEPAAEPAPVVTPPPPPPAPEAPVREGLILDGAENHRVSRGDTLSTIAARRYGQANMYYFPLIRLANASVVSNPDVIEPGTNLVIPNLQQNLNNPGSRTMLKTEMLSTAVHYERLGRRNAAAEIRNLANRL